MIRIAVCDDEEASRDYLILLIDEQNKGCAVAEFGSAEEYLRSGQKFDLVYIDIELGLGGGMDGMELARQIREIGTSNSPVIIFVTGHEEYVYEAFDVGAFQYLVKPVDRARFSAIFGRAVKFIEGQGKDRDLEVHFANTVKSIPLGDIFYMESFNHKVIVHSKEGRTEYYARIGELEQRLKGRFFRIHRGYLVNLDYVESYSRTEAVMSCGDSVLISKYKYGDFVKAYMRHIAAKEAGQPK
ncbi:MAG: LytTR family DNA-binding domain-containing protein [Butyrivibrio sp.]|nr:LytTR family DNA-binding domain-containing protein [Butyrivibrio sp.]